jgi:N-acetylglucosamine kinase-like BadF-type ATPase
MPYDLLVGVDLGGTRLRLLAEGRNPKDGVRDWMRAMEKRAPTLDGLPDVLRRLFTRWRVSRRQVTALGVAAKGVWTRAERRALEHRLRSLARGVRVISDAEAAHVGALEGHPGILVLAGTGSIVIGRGLRFQWRRAGGLGPLLGDEGSAFWIGREWLRLAAQRGDLADARSLARAPDAVVRIAALAPGVLRRARRGHPEARRIVRGAQEHLAGLTARVARSLPLPRPVPVSWAGSLMGDPTFRAGFRRALARRGLRARLMAPRLAPIHAAYLLASWIARRKAL